MLAKRRKSVVLLFIIFLISSIVYFYANQKEKNFNPLTNVNNDQIQKLITNANTEYIYVGRPTCEECQNFLPKLKSVLIKKEQKIFYYNIDNAREENQDKLVQELNKLDIKIVPTILYVENGKVSKKLEGDINKNKLEQFLTDG
ncbi:MULTISPECIES: thioredoxin family protein [Enterococcus]|uniref:Uncharacterized protein n=1 Tax=Enterococcus thailandicus TaxID=417368 RepID=A0A179ETZ0_ENTTH|nr:thioredoxin family protein [Enterococcus thailandicus]OAQ56668.1 hypothetical protein A6E74_11820 [Enterococcus thailandicus]